MDQSNSERRFRTVFENAPIGIAIADRNGRFLEVNQTFSDMLGYAPEEICRKTFVDITHPDDRAETLRLYQSVHDRKMNSYQQEKRYLTQDGRSVWVIVRATALRD